MLGMSPPVIDFAGPSTVAATVSEELIPRQPAFAPPVIVLGRQFVTCVIGGNVECIPATRIGVAADGTITIPLLP